MNVTDVLQNITRLFLDTAPVIYFVERNPRYYPVTKPFFDHIDNSIFEAVTSPVTLAECLVIPDRLGQTQLQQDFQDLIIRGNNTLFMTIDDHIGITAANLRARHNLTLPDTLQLAVAIEAGCDAFLTNDTRLKRVTALQVLVLDEITI